MVCHTDVIEVLLVVLTTTFGLMYVKGQVQRCGHNIAPGLDKMARGVDITKLDLTPMDFTGQDGFKSRVIEYTCVENHSILINGVSYQMPDQVMSVDNIRGGWLSSEAKIFKNYKEVKRSMSANAGGGLNLGKFGFSFSGSYTRMQHAIVNTSHYVEQVSAFDSASRVDLAPYWILDINLAAKVFIDRRLPPDFLQNPARYGEFIDHFGTHFVRSAKFGGLITLFMETSAEYYREKSEQDVQRQAEASFLQVLRAKGGYSGNINTLDQRFQDLTTTTLRYYGGDTNLLSSSGLSNWQPTVKSNPWLFSAELSPISELIADDQKRESLERAITNHMLRAFLNELERLLRSKQRVWTVALSKIDSLLNQVETMKGVQVLEQSVVENLETQVEEQVVVPMWFGEQTQLCYQWYADGDGGQCGGAPSLLCATPNSMTSYYRDDTDRRSGGCQMHWGILATGHANWFNAVQICFRWYPDGDGGQCGGGVGRELCAPVNSYTTYYRDDTDSRGGGCQMSWRVVVPDSAPAWAQNIKLCYEWYPDGDGGQCGGGADRKLCALANQWTAWYRDDTDSRPGGCQMQWGLKTT